MIDGPLSIIVFLDGPRINDKSTKINKLLSKLEVFIYDKIPMVDLCIKLDVDLENVLQRNRQCWEKFHKRN